MTGVVVLGLVITALTVLACYLDAIAFDPFAAYRTDPRDLVDRAHQWRMDLREPGEPFCAGCPDPEACSTGYPCELVQHVSRKGSAA